MEVGDILESSWGYDQTNVSFYKVIEVKGMWAKVRKLMKKTTDNGNMTGVSTPLNEFAKSPPIRRKIIKTERGEFIKINSYAIADLWDGTPSYTSWYA